jgi:hypothetical protein
VVAVRLENNESVNRDTGWCGFSVPERVTITQLERGYMFDKLERYLAKKMLVPTLEAGTSEEWSAHEENIRLNYKAFHVISTVLWWIDLNLCWIFRKLDDVIWWVRHRTTNVYHKVDTKLKPGYYDKDTLMLHANFSLLVDYVESECAWMENITKPSGYKSKWSWKPNEEEGMEYLNWKIADNYEPRSTQAREVVSLYKWWKYEYLVWEDPYDMFEDVVFGDEEVKDPLWGDGTFSRKKIDKIYEVEEKREAEIETNLIRLMKIRIGLWT